jgi:hypothetical protein
MFTNLLASARELRFPITIGYATLLALWLLFGEELAAAARQDDLGRRLLAALDSIGSPAVIGIVTFFAAMVGSVLWHGGAQRLVRFISAKSGHPKWSELIDEARKAARQYGEYRVVTYKGPSGDKPAPFDAQHSVPSAAWATHLAERVQERERKAAEMSFRVTLALALIPVALALGIEGSGLWWLSLLAIPVIWLDVALLKYTTLRTVNRFKTEDLQEKLKGREANLASLEAKLASLEAKPPTVAGRAGTRDPDAARKRLTSEVEQVTREIDQVRADLADVNRQTTRRTVKFFAFLEGRPAED